MPIPLLVVGLGAAIGIGGHLSAKETNEKAAALSNEAQELYNEAKDSLEKKQKKTEKALLNLGYKKKNVLDHSMKKFVNAYNKVQQVSVTKTVGLNELSNFEIDQQGVLQIQKMTDIYSGSIGTGATGAAAGAIVALAASGELALVTDILSIAGSALAMGEVGAAVGIAGSALSLGAAMTPLSAVAAPVLLFTGISASMKADENLEKAKTMYAEAETAVEKMKVSETLCVAIADRAKMLDDVLESLNVMFSECTNKLEQLISKKERRLHNRKLTSADFTENDLKLLAVTGALAGATKSIIDAPILTTEGSISEDSKEIYDKVLLCIPDFKQEVEVIKTLEYDIPTAGEENPSATNEVPKATALRVKTAETQPNPLAKFARWIIAIFFFVRGVVSLFSGSIIGALIQIIIGLIIRPKASKTQNNVEHKNMDRPSK